MRVLVTGAYGFLGRYTSKKFKAQGHQVTGIGHGKWYSDEYIKWGLDVWVESTITFETLMNINQTFDLIIHCGGSGSVSYSTANPYEDFQKSVQSTLAVLEYIRIRCPKCKFIYPSSIAVKGTLPDMPIKEDDLSEPISVYGFHKQMSEDICKSYHKNFGITIGIIRFFSIYGVELQKQLLYDACKKIENSNGEQVVFWGTGTETRDWVNVEDAAALIYALGIQVKGIDTINGGSGNRVEIAEVLTMLKNEIASSIDIVFNGEVREGDPRFFWSDNTKSKKYGWHPSINLSHGIKSYVKYYRSLKK